MKKNLSILFLYFLLIGSSNANEIINLICKPEDKETLIFQIDYKNSRLKQGNGGWKDIYFDDNNIYNVETGKEDPDLGKLYFTKRINRYSGEFIFYATFLKGNTYKQFLEETFKKMEDQKLEPKDIEFLKILSDQIRTYADQDNIIKANCTVENELKQKF